jgi:hypothetical protein
VPAAKWSINKPASRRAQPAVAGRGLSEGLGRTLRNATWTLCSERQFMAGLTGSGDWWRSSTHTYKVWANLAFQGPDKCRLHERVVVWYVEDYDALAS